MMAAAAQVAAATNVDVTSLPGMFLCLVVGGVVVGAALVLWDWVTKP